MSDLSHLTPKLLWELFSQICAIPHPSHHEQALSDFIIDLAKKNHIPVETDEAGNILLKKTASKGMEKRPSVVLQAHLDMVPEKNDNTQHDFLKDPIQPYVDGDWVKAKGTTLGADNGIGMASTLAVLLDPTVEHGPLEVLLTCSEETGMSGAFGLQPNWLTSKLLINTDSEREGEICIGCAGGLNFTADLPLEWQKCDISYPSYQLALTGLKGGHSGIDIHLGRGNANKIMARFLFHYAQSLGLSIVDLHGGVLRNAIPREAYSTIILTKNNINEVEQACQEFIATLTTEFNDIEPTVTLTLTKIDQIPEKTLTPALQQKVLAWLNSVPNGVISMSNNVKNVVESSLNLGIVTIKNDTLSLVFLVRSLTDSSKNYIVDMLTAHTQLVGAASNVDGNYPGWAPDPTSKLLAVMKQNYQRLFMQVPNAVVLHAGLESGLFKQSYPDMDMISFGPTIVAPHSPDERVNIKSVMRYWQLLIATLKNI